MTVDPISIPMRMFCNVPNNKATLPGPVFYHLFTGINVTTKQVRRGAQDAWFRYKYEASLGVTPTTLHILSSPKLIKIIRGVSIKSLWSRPSEIIIPPGNLSD